MHVCSSSSESHQHRLILTAIFVVGAIATAWHQVGSFVVDPNTVVTNVDDLPSAVQQHKVETTTNKLRFKRTKPVSAVETDLPVVTERTGYKHPAEYFSDTYVTRTTAERQAALSAVLAQQWGSWTLESPYKNKKRSMSAEEFHVIVQKYPAGDIPADEFPANFWLRDENYMKEYLQQSIELTERGLKAILAEYGHYDITQDSPEYFAAMLQDATAEDNAFMFNYTLNYPGVSYSMKRPPYNAGLLSPQLKDHLKRYLLHAIMTQDSFIITMGGHSSAAGHGNHFQQSYTLQIQRALEPVFARLGVYHVCRNVGMGGLGTAHNSLGATDLYGNDNSILIWDSGMTEIDMKPRDLFARQGLLSNRDKVPLLFNNPANYPLLGFEQKPWGAGFAGVPDTDTVAGIPDMPYATRYLKCNGETNAACRKDGYNGVCWIDRQDFEPPTKQLALMGGRAKWHPGNTAHQLTARIKTFFILKVLREGLLEWQASDNYILPDDAWHVSSLTRQVRQIVTNVTSDQNDDVPKYCLELPLPDLVCTSSFHARSEMTPRANPAETSIRSILHPDVNVPDPEPNAYDPPDVYNPAFDPPDGHIDYVAIMENGNDFLPLVQRRKYVSRQIQPRPTPRTSASLRKHVSQLPAGQGWNLETAAAADNCDGTYNSFCNRGASSTCLLYGHNDNRGGLIGDGLSGWLFMTLQDVKHGTIIIRVLGHAKYGNERTKGWKCENNATECAHPGSDAEANANAGQNVNEDECEDFTFEFSINGEVTIWNKAEVDSQKIELERLINVYIVGNETNLSPDEDTAVEFGFRIGGTCGRQRAFHFSHVYWA